MMRPEYSREYTRIADDLGIKPEVVDTYANECYPGDPTALARCYMGQYEDDKDFAQCMAEEATGFNWGSLKWPFTCIDWDHAARELMYDYTRLDVLVSGGKYEYHYVSNH